MQSLPCVRPNRLIYCIKMPPLTRPELSVRLAQHPQAQGHSLNSAAFVVVATSNR
jgi:hypothetical protein